MNRTAHVLLISILVMAGCQNKTSNLQKRNIDFNQHWKFINEDIQGAEQPGFDELEWRVIDLTHDWSIEDYDVQDSVHIGPFFKNMENGDDVGYLRGGTGWYRKSFVIESNHKDKEIYLHFDDVQTGMTLWVNGNEAGKHVYDYTPFFFNITPHLNEPGEENILAVKVVNPEQNSRWFAGAGIYRDVTISYLDPVHVDIWGLGVSTPSVTEDKAEISLNLSILNQRGKAGPVDIKA